MGRPWIPTAPKPCEGCGTTLNRSKNESVPHFQAKRFCSAACAKAFTKAQGTGYKTVEMKPCAWCKTPMPRKRFGNGKMESVSEYRRRQFCNMQCSARALGASLQKTEAGWARAHLKARRAKPLTPCERCGSTRPVDRHHKDENINNNSLENIENLCRKCHMQEHHRSTPCKVPGCSLTVTTLQGSGGQGFCPKHYRRFRRHGNPRFVKVNQHTAVAAVDD